MGKSSGPGCLGIIACGHNGNAKESKKTKFSDGEVSQKNSSKRRWSFQKRESHTRVLRTTVEDEPFSPSAERNEEGLIADRREHDMTLIPQKCTLSSLLNRTDVNEEAAETSSAIEIVVSDDVNSTHLVDPKMEESSAIKIQAAIRAYLAKRELCQLKRIVKLQGLLRGQLVRKQAARALRCVQAIIRMQALVRARQVRSSEQGLAIREKLELMRQQNGSKPSISERNGSNISVNKSEILAGKLFSNGFAHQLLESVPKADSSFIKYDQDDPNSGWKWLERWMAVSVAESDSSIQTKNVTKYQNENQNARSPEPEPTKMGLDSNLISVSNLLGVEADKQKLSLTEESKSTSTTSDTLQSEDVSKSAVDSIAQRLNKQLEQVSKSDFSKLVSRRSGAEPNHSETILTQKPYSTEDSCSDQTKAEAENCSCSSTETPNSTSGSVSGQLNMASKENSNPMKDSLDEVYKEAEMSKSSSTKVSSSLPNFVSDLSEVKTESPNIMVEEVSNLTLHSIPAQVEDEVEKCDHSSSKTLTSKLDGVLDQSTVDENSRPKLKTPVNGKHKSNSEQCNGEAEKSMSSSTMMLNLTLSTVSDDTNVEPPEKLSNSGMHSVSSHLQNAQDPTFCSTPDQLESVDEAEDIIYNMDKSSSSKSDPVSDKLDVRDEKLISASTSVSASVPSKSLSDDLHGIQETVEAVQETTLIQIPVITCEVSDDSGARQSIDSCVESIPTDKCESPIKNDSENSGTELKATRRRNSLGPGKADHSSSDSQGSPSLPRYMVATVSAKAKFRPLNSPKSSPDAQEKVTNAKRRNSLSGSYGKQRSGSPQVQRSLSQVQRSTNGSGVDSPRDSTEKPKQADWRR